MIFEVWDSTAKLFERFDKRQWPKEALAVFQEEVREFHHAVLIDELRDTVDEAVDVLVTICAALQSRGIAYEDFAAGIDRVIAKNDAKTHETHYVDGAGKIRRREAVQR